MEAVNERLVRRDTGLIQLLDPPFDMATPNPGYIKGYVPGVRENGGQYTHAAIWAIMAFARRGEARRAWELFTLINPVNHSNPPGKPRSIRLNPTLWRRMSTRFPSYGAGRMDLVYGIRGMDVSLDRGIALGNHARDGSADPGSMSSAGMGRFQAPLSVSGNGLPYRGPAKSSGGNKTLCDPGRRRARGNGCSSRRRP